MMPNKTQHFISKQQVHDVCQSASESTSDLSSQNLEDDEDTVIQEYLARSKETSGHVT